MIYQKKLLGDTFTPVSTFLKVAAQADRCFLLESVEGGERIGRYSFLGLAPERRFEGGFEDFRQAFREFEISPDELPPFCGGAVGLFSYDLIREFEPVGNGDKPGPHLLPSQGVYMDFYSTVLVFDHLKHEIIILSHEGPEKVEEWEGRLLKAHESGPGWVPESLRASPQGGLGYLSSRGYGGQRFQQDVEKAKQHIVDGDIFQVVLSQRFEIDYPGDPFNVYRALRFLNPSPYHFYLKQGDLAVAGASPEMLVRVQGDRLECRPIAGTRRRGRDPQEDEQLAQELAADAKERAEHLMLVDLGRNDLGRVCRFGSVKVDDFMFLERYSHVMHLVSSVSGRLRPEFSALDALQACFPAGTVSGAPKVRAMQIIDEMEPWRRGVYAGAVGYLDYTGNLDTCIAIRTIVFKGGKAYIQAGAGIVADSNPAHEDMECHNKARVLFRALEMGASS